MANLTNHQWVLANRPTEAVTIDNFAPAETGVSDPSPGQILIKVTHLSFDPSMRGQIAENPGYAAAVPVGGVMRSMAAGEVIVSRHPDFRSGDKVTGMFGWQEYALGDPADEALQIKKIPDGVTVEMALSVLNFTGLTAYFGMLAVGQPKSGDVVAVSGAAGATGSIAGQIAKIKGCRVIGIAGGAQKCRWLTDVARFDEAIDYKNERVSRRLRACAPNGINIFYDNVGGEILEAGLSNLAVGARIVLCGAISGYNSGGLPPAPRNYMALIWKSATMAGFMMNHFSERYATASAQLAAWVRDGELKFAIDMQEGFESVPATLLRLFEGRNLGKQLCRIA
jgi:NADPH-dependent curcumin reductase CurA